MLWELMVSVVVMASDGRLFEGAVHPLHLPIGPRMIELGQAMLDAVVPADAIEGMAPQPGGGPLAVPGQIGALDARVWARLRRTALPGPALHIPSSALFPFRC